VTDQHVQRTAGKCVKTGQEFAEGEAYYAVLFEDGDLFRREDYSLDAWDGPPQEAFCWFKTRIPIKDKNPTKRVFVDDDVLITFFKRLADETELARQQFRFVLALILMRKRLLKYEETKIDDGAEYWMMKLAKERSIHAVLNPRLQDDEIQRVSSQLGAILHGDMGEFEDEDTAPEPTETAENEVAQ
jgi:hypothetical protein